jgi:hypothetical protein
LLIKEYPVKSLSFKNISIISDDAGSIIGYSRIVFYLGIIVFVVAFVYRISSLPILTPIIGSTLVKSTSGAITIPS